MKKVFRQYRLAGCILGGVFAAAAVDTYGQENYPTKPVRLIVPSSPGGGTDTTARILVPKLEAALGQQVVVENRPGASMQIGLKAVASSAPDGHTLVIGNSTMSISPSTRTILNVDPIKDLAPISLVSENPQVLAGHPNLPPKTVKELIAFARARPGTLDYASGGIGGNPHLCMELFLNMAGIKIVMIPYKSGNAGLVDVMGGHVTLIMGTPLAVIGHVRSGKLRAYGVTTLKRAPVAPDIPTIDEAGLPGYEAIQWFGIFAPTGTPHSIVAKLHGILVKALQDPKVKKLLRDGAATPRWSKSPEEFSSFMRADVAKWAKIVKAAGIEKR